MIFESFVVDEHEKTMVMSVDALLESVTTWTAARPEVRALVLVGSYANGRAHPGSDVDLVLLSERPDDLLTDRSWVHEFGLVREEAIEEWGRLTSIRVWYVDGPEVEFGVTGLDWASTANEGTMAVLRGGFRVFP